MASKDRRFEKGFFAGRFAVASKYLPLSSRKRLFVIGGIAGFVLCAIFIGDAFAGRATLVVGSLSEKHALFAKNCSTCHTAGRGATNAACESCHRTSSGGPQRYSFARHYQYQSADLERSSPKTKETACANCHREHQGREHSLQAVADNRCVTCHDIGSFDTHPEFEFARKKLSNPANLRFQHILHVREVMDDRKLVDAEQACLTCHTPKPDGRTFEPIAYATGCDGCHLGERVGTPPIPLESRGTPGVVTLADIRKRREPGTQWSDYWNASEFSEQGGELRKRPVYHADPWILYNLKKIRHQLYPGAELADLLNTSAEVPSRDAAVLYREAVQTLTAQITSLRANPSPDVQREIAGLNDLLKQVQQRIDQPFTPLDQSKFAVTEGDRSTAVDARPFGPVIDSLTKPCQLCHYVEKATIRRVKTDQRTLVRAEFNHGAHVIHAKCLDCHNVIPIRTFLGSNAKPAPDQDQAEIVNLPGIQTCRTCHSSGAAPTRCTSCHLFHPDKAHWASLTR